MIGENIPEESADNLKEISEKLEIINLQLAQRKENKRNFSHWFFILICLFLIIIYISLATLGNIYMEWNYNDPELAVLGVGVHAFVWIFMRIAPIFFIGSIIGICLTRKK